MDKLLFKPAQGRRPAEADATNEAGGLAYMRGTEAQLAQLAATGHLGNGYYVSGQEQLDEALKLAKLVDPAFLAKAAVYSARCGLKDMPAVLLGVLSIVNVAYFKAAFPHVCKNAKMIRNFVQVIRSGVTGRKSLGNAPKRCVQRWLRETDPNDLFMASVGDKPSLGDVIKLSRPRPTSDEQRAAFAYLIGKTSDGPLPPKIREFEDWKAAKAAGTAGAPPDLPFRMLAGLDLTTEEWANIALNAPWTATRMNLNTFARHDVFKMDAVSKVIADKLRDREAIHRARAYPYQILTAYQNVGDGVPAMVKDALHDAMEVAVENVPKLTDGQVIVCVDVSGSMHSPITGTRKGATSKTRCVDVAALIAATIARKHPNKARVLPFDTRVFKVNVSHRDSIMTTANMLAQRGGGGTNCSLPMALILQENWRPSLVVYVSDNESWADRMCFGWGQQPAPAMSDLWARYLGRNRQAKLACIDLTPSRTTQVQDRPGSINIGGFSDQVFDLIDNFVAGQTGPEYWVGEIKKVFI